MNAPIQRSAHTATLLGFLLMGAGACATSGSRSGSIERAEARDLLDRQAVCWNTGDLAGFVALYAAGSELTFLGARGLTHGAEDLLAGYEARYPDAATRGVLKFRLEEFRALASRHAMVLGHYQLDPLGAASAAEDVPPMSAGWFTLVIERDGGGLRILHDHTSESPAPQPTP